VIQIVKKSKILANIYQANDNIIFCIALVSLIKSGLKYSAIG